MDPALTSSSFPGWDTEAWRRGRRDWAWVAGNLLTSLSRTPWLCHLWTRHLSQGIRGTGWLGKQNSPARCGKNQGGGKTWEVWGRGWDSISEERENFDSC